MIHLNPVDTYKFPGRVLRIVAVCLALMMTSFSSHAALPEAEPTVSLELLWDPVPEPNVVGYRVYIGTTSGHYSVIEETGTDPSYTVTGLIRGLTYYFAVSAFNDQGDEGELSDELVVIIATPPLPMAAEIATDAANSRQILRWSFPQSALGSSPEIVIQQSADLVTWTEAEVVWSGDYNAVEGDNVIFEWPVPLGQASMFYRLTARNWLGESTVP
ncbi:MAG: fibronectin type III domain-containing protein [Verrucomicrobiota bacterium]